MNLIDKIVGYFSPEAGAQREAWRQVLQEYRNYDAGSHGRTNANWRVFNQSAEGVLNVLEYKGWLVRTVFVQNQLWWVLSDVCNVIHLSNASSAAARLDECEKMTLTQTSSHSGQRGGAQKLLLINVFGLCHLLDTSRKPAAKAFRRWNMTEAMPSILQNGGYILGQNSMDADELRDATDSFARNVLAARDQQVQELLLENKEQAALLREWEPKARYYDAVLCIQGALPISVIAKGYGVSAQAMNRYLHDRMVQYKRAGMMWYKKSRHLQLREKE